jgi:hypothetical protein
MHRNAALAALALSGCCFGGGLGGSTATPTMWLDPGFTPDPNLPPPALSGAGGSRDASAMDSSCRGYVPSSPQHGVGLTSTLNGLRILVHSAVDTTLVVRTPDGRYFCNDDSDGLDPTVSGNFGPGNLEVYVGTYVESDAGAPYEIGFTTIATITPTTLHQPYVGGTGPTIPGIDPSGPPAGRELSRGTAVVREVTGALPGVTPGARCTYVQATADPSSGFDCRWRVECAGLVVYGDGSGGFAPCVDPSWPPGVRVADTNTTSVDRDPSLVVNPGGLTVQDDASGPLGAYHISATHEAGGAPPPMPPPPFPTPPG